MVFILTDMKMAHETLIGVGYDKQDEQAMSARLHCLVPIHITVLFQYYFSIAQSQTVNTCYIIITLSDSCIFNISMD